MNTQKTRLRTGALRAILLLLALCLLLPLAPRAAATSAGGGDGDLFDLLSTVSGLSPLEDTLYRGMMAEVERIDLTALAPAPTPAEVGEAMQHLANAVPELFHVGTRYSTATAGDAAVALTPTYTMTGQELYTARLEYLGHLAAITAEVDPAWSDAEICLFLHDYICRHFAYDTTYTVYDAYGFLTGGTGVCQAYTHLYTALLSRFGIPVTYATGKDGAVAHIWNIVTLDGVQYHVDVTWGDPLEEGEDGFATATHENFLKSDAAIDATGHTERKNHGGAVCNDTRYDGAPFTPAQSSSAFLGGVAYVIDDGHVLALSDDLLGGSEVYAVTDKWRSGLSYLTRRPACLAAYGGLLYVNGPHTILELDPASGHAEAILTEDRGLLMAMVADENVLTYEVAADIMGTGAALYTHTLPVAVPPCTGGHDMRLHASIPSTCAVAGVVIERCATCGYRESTPQPLLPHKTSETVVLPSYGTVGYTELVCTVCGHTERQDEKPALPMPTREDYAAAVRAVVEAPSPEAYLAAVALARAMEPHLDPDGITEERAALARAIAEYDDRAAAIDNDFSGIMTSALALDAGLLSRAASAFAVLFLALRRVLLAGR